MKEPSGDCCRLDVLNNMKGTVEERREAFRIATLNETSLVEVDMLFDEDEAE